MVDFVDRRLFVAKIQSGASEARPAAGSPLSLTGRPRPRPRHRRATLALVARVVDPTRSRAAAE